MDNNLMKLEKLIEKLDRIDGIEFPISDQELCERYENLYTGAVNDVLRGSHIDGSSFADYYLAIAV